jgi:hypothetical protein
MPHGMKHAVGIGHSDWNGLCEGHPPLAKLVAPQLNSTQLTEIVETSRWLRVEATFHADSSSMASIIQARIQSTAC